MGETLTVNLKSVFLVIRRSLARCEAEVGAHDRPVLCGCTDGRHCGSARCGFESRNLGLTHSCAASFAKEGITSNAIAPALIKTEMVTSNLNASPDRIPMGHFGSVDDVGAIAVMLATNNYINGQTINVDGGYYMT